jgi:hypothetical protein
MKDKIVISSLVGVILLSLYFTLFRGCKEEPLQINAKLRPVRRGTPTERGVAPMYDVTFGFNKKYKLTSVKVVSAQDLSTNKYPRALWHVIEDGKSVPVKAISYGKPAPGMKPAIPDLMPDPLEPGQEYVVFVEAGSIKAHTNFFAQARPLPK